ncbi:MAG: DNA polymerase IV [Thermodesulfobacteriota bacterium]|nr:DNA polymerase IV [Thermodesulfobacteriota bacterium]
MTRKIIHIDMDAFYAAVEQRDNPALKGLPVIVGGDAQKRGVVSAASYEARVFGVHSAMPTSQARRLCPQGIFLPVRMRRYQEISEQILAILKEYTPLIEPLSLDESFLDVTGSEKLFGPPVKIAREIKRRIYEATGLTASAGIAPNKFLAKIASDLKKPDGLVEIKPEEVQDFLRDLPISKLWGVGKATEEVLKGMGILTVGQLAGYPPQAIEKRLGKFGLDLIALSRGKDDRPVIPSSETKSISQEETFTPDLHDLETIKKFLLDQSERVGWELRRQRLKGHTVHLKVRYPDFNLVTRSATLPLPTDQGIEIYQTAINLLNKTDALKKKARLLGVGVSNLSRRDDLKQLSLFDSGRKKVERSTEVVDRIRDKFGPDAIKRASLLEKDDEEVGR